MEDLAEEMVELVLSHLPLQELLTSCCLVCSSWARIIQQPRFLVWRKLYHRYKLSKEGPRGGNRRIRDGNPVPGWYLADDGDEEGEDMPLIDFAMKSYLVPTTSEGEEEDLPALPTLTWLLRLERPPEPNASPPLHWLLKFVKKQYEKKENLFSCLSLHPHYEDAKSCLVASVPSLSSSQATLAAWLCLSAASVWDVRQVMRVLLLPQSQAIGQDVTEFLYLLSTLALLFHRQGVLPERVHYLLYHALYFYEYDWACKPKTSTQVSKRGTGQQSLTAFGFARTVPSKTPTAEQLRIIQHPLPLPPSESHLIKIVAFAGTGKTSTLVNLTEANPNIKFLLVVYNKSVRIQAESQFPKSNVTCKTVHQMAWAKAGFMFQKKMTSNLKAKDILDSGLLNENILGEGGQFRRAGQVLSTLNAFMSSSSMQIELDHVPTVWKIGRMEETLSNASTRAAILRDTVKVWKAVQDKDDSRIRIPHDGYLKVWQLRRPSLQRVSEHQVLLVDEGQDMNPAMLDIFQHQNTTRLIVGDPNQQIYLFRGAVNALDLVTATHTYYLTQSFRFGPEIAYVANKCLTAFKDKDSRTLVDSFTSSGRVGQQVAFIGRTNMGVFNKLNQLMFSAKPEDLNRRVGLVGGVEGYNLEDYLDIYRLLVGKKEEMKKFKTFHSFIQFKAFATNVDDVELLGKIKIVEKYGAHVPGLIERIRSKVAKDIKTADTVLSTVHKAKGLEFDTVVLMDDFTDFREQGLHLRDVPEDDANLIYVAITRAKIRLVVNSLVRSEILSDSADYCHLSYYRGEEDHCGASTCNTALTKGTALVVARKVPTMLESQEPEKVLCRACGERALPHLRGTLLQVVKKGLKRKRE